MKTQAIVLRINPMPAPRMTQRSKWTSPQAEAYMTFKKTIFWLVKGKIQPYEKKDSLAVFCRFVRFGRVCDGDNMLKAILDAMQFAEIIPNDQQVVEAHFFVEYTKKKEDTLIDFSIRSIDPDHLLLRNMNSYDIFRA